MRLRRQAACSLGSESSASPCAGTTPRRSHWNRRLTAWLRKTRVTSFVRGVHRPLRTGIVQANNRTTGDAMNLFWKSDAKNHRSSGRDKGLPAPRPVRRSGQAGCPTIKPDLARESSTPFPEDFYSEHSSSSASAVLRSISANSDFDGRATPRNHRASKIDSPSCVYLG
jgi:hypothetical protein